MNSSSAPDQVIVKPQSPVRQEFEGPPQALRFGAFELDAHNRELRRSGVRIKLQAQPLKVLHLLAARAGELVTREEIQEHVWGAGVHVDSEQGINVCIAQIRQALGDRANAPRFVETVPRRGYRFVAPVERASGATEDPPQPEHPPIGRWATGGTGVLVLGLLLLGAVALGWMASGESAPAVSRAGSVAAGSGAGAHEVPRLIVLPFDNLGAGQKGDHLAAGLTEEVITELVRGYGGRLGVIARTTSMKYQDTAKSAAEIASELRLDWVLEGSVRRDGDRVRVSAQLIGADDLHRWANEYDRDLERTRVADLDLQSAVSATIARGVALNLGLVEGAIEELGPHGVPTGAPSPVTAAHESYLDGLYWMSHAETPDAERALAAFRRAVELDPGFAAGWLGVGSARVALGEPDASTAIERALDLDESLPDAHRRLALLRFYRDWDLEGARASWERALELAPHFAEAHHDFAAYWSVTGRHERALAEVRRALDLDPRSPGVTSDAGWYSYFAGRPGEAVERCRETLATDPGYFWAEECILLASVAAGDPSAARRQASARLAELRAPAVIREAMEHAEPEAALTRFLRWDVERLDKARRSGSPVAPTQLAVRRMMLGEGDAALDELERAAALRQGWILPFLPVHPLFDPVRDDPRFRALVHRIAQPPGLAFSRAR